MVPEPNDGRAVVTLSASEKIGHRFATASFASVSKPARVTRLRNSTFHVTECVRRIDRFDPDCATLQNEATTRVIEFYGIRSAFSIQVIREVFTAKQCASNAKRLSVLWMCEP